jgi:hypothetical protein
LGWLKDVSNSEIPYPGSFVNSFSISFPTKAFLETAKRRQINRFQSYLDWLNSATPFSSLCPASKVALRVNKPYVLEPPRGQNRVLYKL